MFTQHMLEICFYRDARNIRSRAIDVCSAGNTHAVMQMLLQLLDILHYCINLAISDYSSFIDVEHLISPKNSFFTQYIFQEVDICGILHSSSKSIKTGCFLNMASPQENFMLFSQCPKSTYRMFFFSCHFRGTFRVFGRSLGSFGSEFDGIKDIIAVLIWCKMFHDVHKFQIGRSMCKFDKLKIMFYWHVGFVYSCSWSFHSILAW